MSSSLVKIARKLSLKYLFAEDEAPDTERTPAPNFPNEVSDPQEVPEAKAVSTPALSIMAFMNFLHALAVLKNKLNVLKDESKVSYQVFNLLIGLRPGVLRNAIKGALESNSLTKEDYASFYNDFATRSYSSNLSDWLFYLTTDLKELDKAKHEGLIREIESLMREANRL